MLETTSVRFSNMNGKLDNQMHGYGSYVKFLLLYNYFSWYSLWLKYI